MFWCEACDSWFHLLFLFLLIIRNMFLFIKGHFWRGFVFMMCCTTHTVIVLWELWEPKYNKAKIGNTNVVLRAEQIQKYAIWTFSWSTVSPFRGPWKSEHMSHQTAYNSLKREELKHDQWSLLPVTEDNCPTLMANVRLTNAQIS